MMTWLEVSLRVIPEAAEAVTEVLSRYAPSGIAIILDSAEGHADVAVTVKAYVEIDESIEEKQRKIAEGLWYLHAIWPVIPEATYTPIADQDWTAGWKESIPVLHVGKRIIIKPSWRVYAACGDEVVLGLDPGLAFGSGLHPTTQLCIEALDEQLRPGMCVMDIGTGTGILALVAAKLGADHVLAIDTDENAITSASRNIENNHAQDFIQLRLGTFADVDGAFDLIVANILSPVIISMVESGLAKALKTGGIFIASGILKEQVGKVKNTLQNYGFHTIVIREKEDWAALIANVI